MKTALLIITALTFGLVSCTDNQRARSMGGEATVKVPVGQKVVGATWKEAHLWYLTRPMREGEVPETSTLRESSSFGIVEGKVHFVESK